MIIGNKKAKISDKLIKVKDVMAQGSELPVVKSDMDADTGNR